LSFNLRLNGVVLTTVPFTCRNRTSVNGRMACWGRYILTWSIACGLARYGNREGTVSPMDELRNIHNIGSTDFFLGSLESSDQPEVAFVRRSNVFWLFSGGTSSVSLPA
jgi:hypothetical protein